MQLCRKPESFFRKLEAFFQICGRVLQKSAGLYVPKFPKNSAASLTDVPQLHLGLPEMCPYQRGKGFRILATILKTRTVRRQISSNFSWTGSKPFVLLHGSSDLFLLNCFFIFGLVFRCSQCSDDSLYSWCH